MLSDSAGDRVASPSGSATFESMEPARRVIFLELDELLHVATRTLGAEPEVRDLGLLDSALARQQASALGEDATQRSIRRQLHCSIRSREITLSSMATSRWRSPRRSPSTA